VFQAFLEFRAFVAQEFQTWTFATQGSDPCDVCQELDGKVFEVLTDDELLEEFEYGEFVDSQTFKPNVHPNCMCVLTKSFEGQT
jgi:hypothetical protein